jgi:hypothetical protein
MEGVLALATLAGFRRPVLDAVPPRRRFEREGCCARPRSRELFPELAGQLVDVDVHAPSVIIRALNDGSAVLQDRVIGYYGEECR